MTDKSFDCPVEGWKMKRSVAAKYSAGTIQTTVGLHKDKALVLVLLHSPSTDSGSLALATLLNNNIQYKETSGTSIILHLEKFEGDLPVKS